VDLATATLTRTPGGKAKTILLTEAASPNGKSPPRSKVSQTFIVCAIIPHTITAVQAGSLAAVGPYAALVAPPVPLATPLTPWFDRARAQSRQGNEDQEPTVEDDEMHEKDPDAAGAEAFLLLSQPIPKVGDRHRITRQELLQAYAKIAIAANVSPVPAESFGMRTSTGPYAFYDSYDSLKQIHDSLNGNMVRIEVSGTSD